MDDKKDTSLLAEEERIPREKDPAAIARRKNFDKAKAFKTGRSYGFGSN